MRWPLSWLFRAAAEPSPGDGASAGSMSPGDAAAAARPSGDWRRLPAIQPTVARLDLTAPTEAFRRGLAVAHEPEPVLGHLGHDVRADGPAGLVSGLTRPVLATAGEAAAAAPGSGPDLPVHHTVQHAVQRAVDGGPAATGISRPADGGAEMLPGMGPGGDVRPRSLAVVEATDVTPAIAATAVAPESVAAMVRAQAPLVGRLTVGAPPAAPGSPPAPASPAAPGSLPAPEAPAGLATAASPGVDDQARPGEQLPGAPVEERVAPLVQPIRRTLAESRRLGLGAPLPAVPPGSAGAGRAATPGSGPGELPFAGRVEAPVAARVPVQAAARAATATLPVLHLARADASKEAGPEGSLGTQAGPAGEPGWEPSPTEAASGGTSPLLGLSRLAVAHAAAPPAPPGEGEAGMQGLPPGASDGDAGDADRGMRQSRPPVTGGHRTPGPPGAATLGRAAAEAIEPAPGPPGAPASKAGPAASGAASSPAVRAPLPPSPPARPVVARLVGERALRPLVEPLVPVAASEEPAAGQDAEVGTIPGLEGLPGPTGLAAAAPGATPLAGMAAESLPPAGTLQAAWPMPAGRPSVDWTPAPGATGSGRLGRLVPPAPASPRSPAIPPATTPATLSATRPAVARLAAGSPGSVTHGDASESAAAQAILAAGSWTAAAGPTLVEPPEERLVAAAGPGTPFGAAAVQRQATPTAAGSTDAAGAEPTAGAAGAAGPGAGNRDQDMDELARKLYGRIRERLSAELLADRERAGLLVDV